MHGYLEMVRYKDSEYPRPMFDHLICSIGPDYTQNEEQVFDYLWKWLKLERGLFIGVNWYPEVVKERKVWSEERKLKARETRLRNKLKKKYPLFYD